MQDNVAPPPVALQRTVPTITPEQLASLYAAEVQRFAAMVCRNHADADDLAQEAMLRAMRSLHRYDPARGEMGSWLWRIVVNAARDAGVKEGRARRIWESVAASKNIAANTSVEDVALRRMEDAELLNLVRRLRPRHRQILALRFGSGLRYAEIARALGSTEAAVTMALRRALEILHQHIIEDTLP